MAKKLETISSTSRQANSRLRTKKNIPHLNTVTSESHLPLILVTIASITSRLYNIQSPSRVCWDETHFGKMASWYLNRTFFFDVHPPLGKMMIALSGHLTGYDAKFPFDKPGDEYEDSTQYVGMRTFCAFLGAAIPPIVYLATRAMTRSTFAAVLAAGLILFDNGMVTLTRFILLDPPLLFFQSAAILGMAKISFEYGPARNNQSYSGAHLFWLTWTGVALSCTISVKFVGLFIVALVGLRTIYDIWVILGDISKPIQHFLKYFTARVLCLIILPILLYVTFFWIHLRQLDHSGNGDGFYSSSFQSQLIGNSLHNSSWPAHLAYDAEVTLKNNRIGGAYLHSHWHLYPEGVGARQQQITTYSHKDSNNKWLIKRGLENDDREDIYVRDGDIIKLQHVVTKRNLHSHFEYAPLTKRHYQVTGYGENGVGDANDLWKVVKESTGSGSSVGDDRIFTVVTRFKLVHYLTNCALHSHNKRLPKWAYEQLEVTCNPKLFDNNNLWNIEDNFYPHLPNVSFEEYAPSFIDRFIESHAVMLQGNSALKPKEGEVTSRPWQWPINYRGQLFLDSDGQKIYLLGNPLVWLVNIVTIPLSAGIILILTVIQKIRGPEKITDEQQQLSIASTYLEAGTWTLLGWALHYLPFYFMGRVLYFHHYFPAFIFSCMLTAMTYDFLHDMVARRIGNKWFHANGNELQLATVILSFVIYTFIRFLPLTYGTKADILGLDKSNTTENLRSKQHLSSLKWLDSWEF